MRTEDIGTEVFFLPGGVAHREGRQLHQHPAAAAVARQGGRAAGRLPLGALVRLPPVRAGARAAGGLDRPEGPARSSTWPGTTRAAGPAARSPTPTRCCRRSTAATADGSFVREVPGARRTTARRPAARGSTPGIYADGVNQTARKKPGSEQNWIAPEWGWAWPANRRILYNRASADPDGKPWSERKRYVWWDAEEGKWTSLRRRPRLRARQAARTTAARGRHRHGRDRAATSRSSSTPTGWAGSTRRIGPGRRPAAGALRAARVAVRQPALRAATRNPTRQLFDRAGQPVQPAAASRARGLPVRADDLPAHRAPHRRRHVAHGPLPRRAAARDVLRGVARSSRGERGLEHGGWATIVTTRTAIEARVLVTERMRPLRVMAATSHQVGAALPLGPPRARRRATPPTSCCRSCSTATCTSPSTRWRRATSGPAGGRGAALLELVAEYRRRAGVSDAEPPRGPHLRRRGASRAGLLHRHVAVHRLQGVRGRLQGVEPGPGRPGFTGSRTTTRGDRAPRGTTRVSERCRRPDTRGGARARSSSSRSQAYQDGRRPALADGLRRLQALHPRRLPGGLPDRRAVPHRVRHGRRAAGHLQRLRLLRAGVPVRRDRPARGRRARLEVHALLRPPEGRHGAGVRAGVPDALDPVRRARRAARARRARALEELHAAGEEAPSSTSPTTDDGVGGARRVLPAARRARGLRAAAGPGRHDARPRLDLDAAPLARRGSRRRWRRAVARARGGERDGAPMVRASRAPTTAGRSSRRRSGRRRSRAYFFAGGMAGASAGSRTWPQLHRQRRARAARVGGGARRRRRSARRC